MILSTVACQLWLTVEPSRNQKSYLNRSHWCNETQGNKLELAAFTERHCWRALKKKMDFG